MHYRFFRDSFWGRLLYHTSQHKLFSHKEEQPDYVVPEKYLQDFKQKDVSEETGASSLTSSLSGETVLSPEVILVSWDGDDDEENPRNWPLLQKCFFIFEIGFLTVSVYMGSAIYTPGIEEIMEQFGIGQVLATFPLTFFVLGYGFGPMIFSPMSENAIFGRTSIYIVTLFIFFILQIPTALAKNIASLTVLRFLAGIFASPALATGGASVAEVLSLPYIPVGIAVWSLAAVCGPSMGPLIGSVLTVKGGWRWTFWFMAIISGACFLVLGWMLPETYEPTNLTRKAKRLRALTGNPNIKSQGELDNEGMTLNEFVSETLYRPFEVTIVEPVVLLINIYIALVYAILYLWFEAFPIVFVETKHFTLVEMGVSYVSIMVGIGLGAIVYITFTKRAVTLKFLQGLNVEPEVFIPIAIVGSILMPIGIFIFGWSSAADLHWMGPLIGAAVFACGAFFIFQTLFNYMSFSFKPQYMASIFASNDFFRSTVAGVFPLFGRYLYDNLKTSRFPVGWGSTVLGFITLGMIAIPVLFYINGPKLRARSKFAN